jgi:hypothetical protein
MRLNIQILQICYRQNLASFGRDYGKTAGSKLRKNPATPGLWPGCG